MAKHTMYMQQKQNWLHLMLLTMYAVQLFSSWAAMATAVNTVLKENFVMLRLQRSMKVHLKL